MSSILMRQKGFTLIELLIVVAIIAIMASIAVPNFQEAVTRSKVAKFMGSANSLASGLEIYAADNGMYPPADRHSVKSQCSPWFTNPPHAGEGYMTRLLSTPIAYMSKIPYDPFLNKEDIGRCEPERRTYFYSNDMVNKHWYSSTNTQNYVNYTYFKMGGNTGSYRVGDNNAVWFISSPGPDMDRDQGRNSRSTGGNAANTTDPINYDPSNGTVSDGDLFLFGPGLGFANDS